MAGTHTLSRKVNWTLPPLVPSTMLAPKPLMIWPSLARIVMGCVAASSVTSWITIWS